MKFAYLTFPFLNHKILELEEHYRSLSPTSLVSPVMFTSSLLENHFKIKINIPFTCNIIIKYYVDHTQVKKCATFTEDCFQFRNPFRVRSILSSRKKTKVSQVHTLATAPNTVSDTHVSKVSLFCYSVSRNQP